MKPLGVCIYRKENFPANLYHVLALVKLEIMFYKRDIIFFCSSSKLMIDVEGLGTFWISKGLSSSCEGDINDLFPVVRL